MIIKAFTVCVHSEITQARQLKNSILLLNPHWTFEIFLIDSAENLSLADDITLLRKESVPSFQQLEVTYTIEELRSYIKAYCSKKLLQNSKYQAIAYFHPATKFSKALTIFESSLQQANILLFPLLTKQLMGKKASYEKDYLNRGLLNPNAWVVKNTTEGKRFVNWLYNRLLIKGQTNLKEGLGSDRLWLMHVPIFFEKVQLLPLSVDIFQLPIPVGLQNSISLRASKLLKKWIEIVWTWQPF